MSLREWAKEQGLPKSLWDKPDLLRKLKKAKEKSDERGVIKEETNRQKIKIGEKFRIYINGQDTIGLALYGINKNGDLRQTIVRDISFINPSELKRGTVIKAQTGSKDNPAWVDTIDIRNEDEFSYEIENVKKISDIPLGQPCEVKGLVMMVQEMGRYGCLDCHSTNIKDNICQKCGSANLGKMYVYRIELYLDEPEKTLSLRTKKLPTKRNFEFGPGDEIRAVLRKRKFNDRFFYNYWFAEVCEKKERKEKKKKLAQKDVVSAANHAIALMESSTSRSINIKELANQLDIPFDELKKEIEDRGHKVRNGKL